MPSVRAVGTNSNGASSITPGLPTGHASGDALYLVMESCNTSNAAGTPSTPSGYSKLFEATDLPGNAAVTTLTIFGKIDGGSESAPTVTGFDDHGTGRIVAVQGHGLAAITDTVVGTNTQTTGTSLTSSGITVVAGSLVLLCVGTTRDSAVTNQFDSWTDANLTSITEQADNVVATGAGGGIGIASGDCAGTASGTFTVTQATSSASNAVQLGIPPPSTSVTAPVGAITLAADVASLAIASTITAPVGALVMAADAPTIFTGTSTQVTAPVGVLTLGADAPTISAGTSASVTAPVGVLTLSADTHSVSTGPGPESPDTLNADQSFLTLVGL